MSAHWKRADCQAAKKAATALIDAELRKGPNNKDDPRIPSDLEVFPVCSL
jgi:hypothetical protein